MIHQRPEFNAFELVRVATLRAEQLMRGSHPRVPASHRFILTAQLEVASGKVRADVRPQGPRPSFSPNPVVEPAISRAGDQNQSAMIATNGRSVR